MKKFKTILGILLMTALIFTSCSGNDDGDIIITAPTAQEFADLKQNALDSRTQEFSFNAEDGSTTFTSEKGVQITIQGSCLTLNGNGVTGQVNIKYIELFDRGNMITTNKTTMGMMQNGDKALLISGGEFFVEATQNGQILQTTCTVQLIIPSNLTGGTDNAMTLWKGRIDANDNLTWDEEEDGAGAGHGGVFAEGGSYFAFLNDFGWSNVDRFYNDPRPKTTILVGVPEDYDNTNSAVYLSYDGENAGLANLDTFDNATKLFSEHYGQVPIGLECHIIFISEDNGNYRYAIKAVTIAANDIYTFTFTETSVVTEAQITAIINGLP